MSDFDTSSTDAMHWAKQFCQHMRDNKWTPEDIDEELMVGWFANFWAACQSSPTVDRTLAYAAGLRDGKEAHTEPTGQVWHDIKSNPPCGDLDRLVEVETDPLGNENFRYDLMQADVAHLRVGVTRWREHNAEAGQPYPTESAVSAVEAKLREYGMEDEGCFIAGEFAADLVAVALKAQGVE